jgi:hypothetical protein
MFKAIIAASVAAVSIAAPVSAQVTSVTQLKDVSPSDWSYQAISDLISRYGCVAGFPDQTFRPGQPATRADLASLIDSCLERVSEFQDAKDAQMAAALKAQAAQWKGTQAAVAELQLAAAQKAQGVGNYVGLAVNLNRQGVNGGGYGVTKTVSGANLQVRYAAKTFSNQNAISVRPYINASSGPSGNIGTAGGALVSYDVSIAKAPSGVSKANLYGAVGYQIPFVNNSEANFQSAIGNRGQFVLALGAEAKVTKSLIGYSQLTFPTTNAAPGTPYSPVYSAGLGVKF